MSSFHLQIVTLDGLCFDGEAEKLIVRTVDGEVCILAKHINYVAPLGMGEAKVVTADGTRTAACIGGLVVVTDGEVRLAPTTFEWSEDIDAERAENARKQAEALLADRKNLSQQSVVAAEAKLRRALVRQSVANNR